MSRSSSPISSGNSSTRVFRQHPVSPRLSAKSSDTTPGNSNSDSETEHANIIETPKRPKTQKKYTKKKEGNAKTAGKSADTKEKIIKRPKATGTKEASEQLTKTKSEASKNEVPKKITTKDMINRALTELNTRKGVSLYAIKKFIAEKYDVDTEKVNHIIKRQLKIGVEEGRIRQTKGVGASGSFKRIATKGKQAKDKTEQTEPAAKKSKPKETDKAKIEKKTETKPKTKKEVASVSKTKGSEQPTKSTKKSEQPTKKSDKATKNSKKSDVDKKKTVKIKTTNGETNAPSAKKTQGRRKSIVKIKPPKMKPKAST